jgi:hypothetical protein
MSDTSAIYKSSVSSATTSPGPLTGSNEPSLDFDRKLLNDTASFSDFNFDFLTSLPNSRDALNDTYIDSGTKPAGSTLFDQSQSLWQIFPTSMTDLDHGTLRSVSTHPIFSQDQVASFQNSFEKVTHRNNDCLALALQLVNDLSVTNEACMVTTSNPMASVESHRTEVRDVDTVLFINRDAAQSVQKILRCTCSSDQAVALACYLATTKIVGWYGAVIEAVGEYSDQSTHPRKDSGHKTSPSILAKRIVARPVYMGSKYYITYSIYETSNRLTCFRILSRSGCSASCPSSGSSGRIERARPATAQLSASVSPDWS